MDKKILTSKEWSEEQLFWNRPKHIGSTMRFIDPEVYKDRTVREKVYRNRRRTFRVIPGGKK